MHFVRLKRKFRPVQARVQSVNQVLFGWFTIPDALEVPLDFNVNPLGNRMRSEKRVWNDGKQRLKLVSPCEISSTSMSGRRRGMRCIVGFSGHGRLFAACASCCGYPADCLILGMVAFDAAARLLAVPLLLS